jgi:hypothetical protein
MTINLFVGNTAPSVTDTLRQTDSSGALAAIDLAGVTVSFRLRSRFSGVGDPPLIDAPAVVVSAPAGQVRYDWALADTTTAIDSSPGPYLAWWHLDFGAGILLDTFEFPVEFWSHESRRSIGPCTDWCSTQDVVACFDDVTPDSCLTSAVTMASELLYELSGRLFQGWCQSVIRPCARGGCGMQILSRGHIVSWHGYSWHDEHGDVCSCGYEQTITLPGWAQRVVEVMIGGEVIPSTSYRLDPDGTLFRTDGGAWPVCQNMSLDGDAAGAFQVTYAHGLDPTELGRRAAAQLAREFWLACNSRACRLPAGVVQIVRQGVTITRAATLFADGATGLEMVDAFLAGYAEKDATLVMSPETMTTSRRTA